MNSLSKFTKVILGLILFGLVNLTAEQAFADDTVSNSSPANNLSKPNDTSTNTSKPAIQAKKKHKKKAKRRKLPNAAPCLTWQDPDVSPFAALLCVHGLGLHNGTYEELGKALAKKGVVTYAIDVRGFGSFMQANGRKKVDFESCLEDVRQTLRFMHKVHPKLPVFILGESMGGGIALQATARYSPLVSGLISSVPAGDRFHRTKEAVNVGLHLITGFNKPFNVGKGVIKAATDNEDLRKEWALDPLAKTNLSPSELIQFQKFMNKNHKYAKQIKSTPVMIVQGSKDKLVKPEGTVELFNEIACQDKQLILIKNAEHLIFEENQFTNEEVDLIVNWMKDHVKQAAD